MIVWKPELWRGVSIGDGYFGESTWTKFLEVWGGLLDKMYEKHKERNTILLCLPKPKDV